MSVRLEDCNKNSISIEKEPAYLKDMDCNKNRYIKRMKTIVSSYDKASTMSKPSPYVIVDNIVTTSPTIALGFIIFFFIT